MATTAPPLSETESQLLDLPTLDFFLGRADELLTYPDRETIEGTRRDVLILRIQEFAYQLVQKGLLTFKASFIYADNPKVFLEKLVTVLRSIRPKLEEQAQPERRRTQQEITEEYEKQQTPQTSQEAPREGKRHTAIHAAIEAASKRTLLSRKERALIAEHLETTEALTGRLTNRIEETNAAVAHTILNERKLMDTLSPLSPSLDAQHFLAAHLAENIQDALSNATAASDIAPGKIRAGVATALEASVQGRQLTAYLDANPEILDGFCKTLIQNHAGDLAQAARYGRSIAHIFQSVGGDRLEAFIAESEEHLGEELLEQIRKTLSVDPSKILATRELAKNMQRAALDALEQNPTSDIQEVVKTYLIENQQHYPFLQSSQDIHRLASSVSRNNGKLAALLASGKRLRRLRYNSMQASQNTTLLAKLQEDFFPGQLLVILNDWQRLSLPDLASQINAYFSTNMRRELLFGLLSLDKETLASLKEEYRQLLGTPRNTKDFWRGLRIFSYIEDVERFQQELAKRPDLAKKLRAFWKNNLPKAARDKNFRPFLKNLLETGAPNYYKSAFSQRVFGTQGPSYSGPSFAYIANFFSNIRQGFFSGTDLLLKRGKPRLASTFGRRIGAKLAAKLGLGAIPGVGTALSLLLIAGGFLRKHWKKVAAGVAGGAFYLLNLLGVNALQFLATSLTAGLAGGFLGQLIGIPFPIGFAAGVGVNTFVMAQFGGWGGVLPAIGGAINGFLGGLAGLGGAAVGAVGGVFGGILGGGILATSAVFASIAVLIGSLLVILTIPPPLTLPPAKELAQCTFVRDSLRTSPDGTSNPTQGKIKSSILASLIQDVAQRAQIPAPIIAAVAFVESSDFVKNAGDDHDGILNNYYYFVSQANTSSNRDTNAIGLMQIAIGETDLIDAEGNYIRTLNHCSDGLLRVVKTAAEKLGKRVHDEAGDGGKSYYCVTNPDERIKKFCQTNRTEKQQAYYSPDIPPDDAYINLCRLHDNLMVGAELLNVKIAGGQWTSETDVKKAIFSYYGSCTYPTGNYCDEVWNGYQACQATQIAGPSLGGGQPFTPLPGCVAAKTVVPPLNEYDYPRCATYGGAINSAPGSSCPSGSWPMTCGPTSGAMLLQSVGINSSIEKVTIDWERDGAWSPTQGFFGSAIAPALNKEYPGQIQATHTRVTNATDVQNLIRYTGNAAMVSAYYDNDAKVHGLDKQEIKGNSKGGISLINNNVGHMVVVYQVCSDRVYITDPIFAEQYSIPVSQFNTAVSLPSRGETVSFRVIGAPAVSAQFASPVTGIISLCFGATEAPYSPSNPHRGIDIATGVGTQVFAAADGIVAQKDFDSFNGYYVRVNHPGGLQTSYLHLTPDIQVGVGSSISRGQLLGFTDTSGLATGPHLHFGVSKDGAFVDPAPYLGISCSKNMPIQ